MEAEEERRLHDKKKQKNRKREIFKKQKYDILNSEHEDNGNIVVKLKDTTQNLPLRKLFNHAVKHNKEKPDKKEKCVLQPENIKNQGFISERIIRSYLIGTRRYIFC